LKTRDKKIIISKNNQPQPLLLTFPPPNFVSEHEKELLQAKEEAIEKIPPIPDYLHPKTADNVNEELIYFIENSTSIEEVRQLASAGVKKKITSHCFRKRFVIDNEGRIVDCEDILS
jgi:hypothetical protein